MEVVDEILGAVPGDLFRSLWDAPWSRRGSLRLLWDGEGVKFVGEDHDRATLVSLQVVPGLGRVAVVHLEGGTHFAGRGQQAYHGASYRTLLLDGPTEGSQGRLWRFVNLAGLEPPSNRTARAEAHERLAGVLTGQA